MAMPGPGLLVVVTALLVGTATVGDSRHRGDGEHCCKNEGDEFQGSRPVGMEWLILIGPGVVA